ncbi:MAG: type III-A CRISPR-associated RAMP protein Csm4 [Anaerolineae bacterium]|nr:type III-A CRISPR-associated RAMP protein Csm4 [Anaerolineae bacterium]
MTRNAYRLIPRDGGGFHLGREGLDQEVSSETFPSDSLFAALIAVQIAREGSESTMDLLEAPPGLSSVFPFAGQLPLFPMPRLRVNLGDAFQPGMTKALKKLQYVSPAILTRLLQDSSMDGWLPEDTSPAQGVLMQDGRVWLARRETNLLPNNWRKLDDEALKAEALWRSQRVPRVAIDRISNSSQIYHVGRTTFAPGCGLWFLTDLDPQQVSLFESLLEHLGDSGLGGERSAGYGAFRVEPTNPPDLLSPQHAPRVMTLSRYNPTEEELQAGVLGEGASYELVDVGGWLASPGGPAQRRKRVRMIEAGSILAAPVPVVGRIVDVCPEYDQPGAPQHPVWRSGIALTVGVTGGA